jgi:hypothetical protein
MAFDVHRTGPGRSKQHVRRHVPSPVLIGAVCGLAWAASLRAVMAQFSGAESHFDWVGTYEGVLLPGAVVGGLLGWAEHLRRGGDGPRQRRLVAAPLAFTVDPASLMVTLPALAGGVRAVGAGVAAGPVAGDGGRAAARACLPDRGAGALRHPGPAHPRWGLDGRPALLPPRGADHRLRDPATGDACVAASVQLRPRGRPRRSFRRGGGRSPTAGTASR